MPQEYYAQNNFGKLAHDQEFKRWLESKGYGSISSRLSECRWVQRHGKVKLDDEFKRDRCDALLARLEHTSSHPSELARFVGSSKADANPYTNLNSYRNAVALYTKFMQSQEFEAKVTTPTEQKRDSNRPAPRITGLQQAETLPASEIGLLWKGYMKSLELITEALGRTSNIVGEYAERIVAQCLGGKLLGPSHKSADIRLPDGTLVQVKSRVPRQGEVTSLSVIRSWNFDYLAVVLFDTDGSVYRAIMIPKDIARKFAKPNKHQNGDCISTTREFLYCRDAIDLTDKVSAIVEGNAA